MGWLDCSTLDACNSLSEWSLLAILIGVAVDFVVLVLLTKGISRTEKVALTAANMLMLAGLAGEWQFGSRASQIASEQVAKLELEAKQAVLELEKERSARLDMLKQLAPRIITADEAEELRAFVKKTYPSGLAFEFASGSEETSNFLEQICIAVLAQPSCPERLPIAPTSSAGPPFSSLLVVPRKLLRARMAELGMDMGKPWPNDGPDKLMASLLGPFAKLGFGLQAGDNIPEGGAELIAGLKPEPFTEEQVKQRIEFLRQLYGVGDKP